MPKLERGGYGRSKKEPVSNFLQFNVWLKFLTPRTEAEKADLLGKLSQHDYLSPLRRIRKKRYSETSSWLSQTNAFKSWLADSKSSILWLSGIGMYSLNYRLPSRLMPI